MQVKGKQVETVFKIGNLVLNEKILNQIKDFTEEDNLILDTSIKRLKDVLVYVGNRLSQDEDDEREEAIGLLESTSITISYLRNLKL